MGDERGGEEPRTSPGPEPESIRVVRLGHGANCSSVGSVIDTLFVSAVVGGAVFAAICAAMKEEPVRVVGEDDDASDEDSGEAS